MILNINDEDVQKIICAEEPALKGGHIWGAPANNDQCLHEYVEENDQNFKDIHTKQTMDKQKNLIQTGFIGTHHIVGNRRP